MRATSDAGRSGNARCGRLAREFALALAWASLPLACSPKRSGTSAPAPRPAEGAPSASVEARDAHRKVTEGAPAQPADEPVDPELEWIRKRVPAGPLVCYLLGDGREDMMPLDGTLLRNVLLSRRRGAAPRDALELARTVKRLLNLGLTAEGAVESTPLGVRIRDGGKLCSVEMGRRLAQAIARAGAFSLEAILAPADTAHGGPARIVSLSWDGLVRNFTLGQTKDRWVVRLRTSETGMNGSDPELSMRGLAAARTHLVVTYDTKAVRLYLNGELAESREEVRGDLANWDPSYPLVLANEFIGPRNWAGVIRFVAFYDRVLSGADVTSAAADVPPGDPPTGAPGRPGPDVSAPPGPGKGAEVF